MKTAKDICELANSKAYLESYWKELLEWLEHAAKLKGQSYFEFTDNSWEYSSNLMKYHKANEEQLNYIKTLGYKIEMGDHPTKTKTKRVDTKLLGFIAWDKEIQVPRKYFKIEACCGE
jgi:hypothetical protein